MPTEEATMEVAMAPTEEMTGEATMEATEMAMATEAPMMGPNVMVSPDESIVIGLATGLSGEGIAPLGIDIQRGAELALEDRPTVMVDGKEFKVSLDVQDDQCSADGGQSVANRFASDGSIVGVVGPMCSSACRAAAPIFDAADYTSISPSCTAADLTTSGYSSFNRAVVSDAFQGVIAAEYIYNVLGVHSIATIHDGSTYGEGLVTVVSDRFETLGGTVVSSDAVSVGDTDFRGLLDDIAQADPELIYFAGFPAEGARLLEQRADAGLETVPFMSADGVLGTEVIDLAGASADGLYATKAVPASSEALDAFLQRYVATYGEEPPAPYHANGYDGVNILLDAVEAVGTVDANGDLVVMRDDVQKYVRSLSNFQGLTGVLNADGTGETSVADIGVFQVQNGDFAQIYTGSVVDSNVVLTPYEAPAAEMTAEAMMEPTEEMMVTEEATMEMMATEEMMPAATEAPMMGPNVMVSPDESIVVGLATGLSGEGIAPLGIDIQRGAELALEDRPTVTVDGKEFKVSLDVQDDQCSADGGQSVANRFASDGSIVGVVGPMCSSACRAAGPIFDAADYTSISPSCTATDLTTSGYSSFNRSVVSDAFQGVIAAEYIYNVLGVHSIATIHDGSTYGEGLVTVVSDRFETLGGTVVSSDAVSVGDTDFRGLLDDIAQADPELIYFAGFPAEGARLLEQRADAGLETVPFMSADGVLGTEVIDLAGASADGLYATKAIAASSEALDAFLQRYIDTYGEEPPAPYHANSYDGVNILLDAVEAVGTVDANGDLVVMRDDVQKYVRSLSNFQGLTGVLNARRLW